MQVLCESLGHDFPTFGQFQAMLREYEQDVSQRHVVDRATALQKAAKDREAALRLQQVQPLKWVQPNWVHVPYVAFDPVQYGPSVPVTAWGVAEQLQALLDYPRILYFGGSIDAATERVENAAQEAIAAHRGFVRLQQQGGV